MSKLVTFQRRRQPARTHLKFRKIKKKSHWPVLKILPADSWEARSPICSTLWKPFMTSHRAKAKGRTVADSWWVPWQHHWWKTHFAKKNPTLTKFLLPIYFIFFIFRTYRGGDVSASRSGRQTMINVDAARLGETLHKGKPTWTRTKKKEAQMKRNRNNNSKKEKQVVNKIKRAPCIRRCRLKSPVWERLVAPR